MVATDYHLNSNYFPRMHKCGGCFPLPTLVSVGDKGHHYSQIVKRSVHQWAGLLLLVNPQRAWQSLSPRLPHSKDKKGKNKDSKS